FPVRGYMLDVSRNRVPSQQSLRELVSVLAELRINQLQLYTEHTFAYKDHPSVWKDASPLTPEEIRELDQLCREQSIELVPNQNSFGHMERWLRHPAYAGRAEIAAGEAVSAPSCLAPTAANADFMHALYRELLPNFTSRQINIGCDETWELGRGQSRRECEARGTGRVYLDFVRRLMDPLRDEGRSVQFWGDIVQRHAELVPELPESGILALVWGYEAPLDPDELPAEFRAALENFGLPSSFLRGFESAVEPFAEHAIPFYVCPGTSAWNSLIGRLPNARANLLDAALHGERAGARGYLVTDWGDNGHLQPPCVGLTALAYGAALSWCRETNAGLDDKQLAAGLDAAVFRDPTGRTGRALVELGSLYEPLGLRSLNASPIALALLAPLRPDKSGPFFQRWWGETDRGRIEAAAGRLEQIAREASAARPEAGDLLGREIAQAARLARHGLWRLGHRALDQGPSFPELRRDLEERIEEQAWVWNARSRPGGLDDTLEGLRRALRDYD
ncbi:MAG: beta-N-acetylhexosaminidase, partial [Myxococcales bacterium]|nr:beta-N-acetylhexosaminidase [Myxococcales bacterium]